MFTTISELYAPWSEFWDRSQVPITKGWPLLGDPVPLFILLAFYNYYVLSLGPRLMKNRPPFNLKRIMTIYNIIQVIMNSYVVMMGIIHVWIPRKYGWTCFPPDETYSEFGVVSRKAVYFYFIMKLMDLTDTIFMVLRKKETQISFLHQYHHIGMCLAGWATNTLMPGGSHVIFFGFINCIVHVIMYSYYTLSIYIPALKQSTWKRRITELQLGQFVITTIHGIYGILDPTCTFPKWALWLYVPQDVFMFALFWDFYVKTYLKPRAKSVKENVDELKNSKKSE